MSPVLSARRAFTLIELLVVIAIIAILAAILFPVFAQAKDAAKKTAALSNVKQMGVGVQMYNADYDDGYPTWSDYYAVTGNNAKATQPLYGVTWNDAACVPATACYWDARLNPYVKSGDPTNGNYGGLWHSANSQLNEKYRSYGIDYYFTASKDPADPWGYRWLNASNIDSPANVVFAGDGGTAGMLSPQTNYDSYSQKYLTRVNYTREAPDRYSGGATYAYADGHAKWVKREKYWAWPIAPATNYSAYNGQNFCIAANYFAPVMAEKNALVKSAIAAGYACTLNQ